MCKYLSLNKIRPSFFLNDLILYYKFSLDCFFFLRSTIEKKNLNEIRLLSVYWMQRSKELTILIFFRR